MNHTRKMVLVPFSQVGSGFNDQISATSSQPTQPNRRRHRGSRQRRMLQIVLRLALTNAYDDSGRFQTESGDHLDIVPLILHALSPGRSVRGIDSFVDLLLRAGVDPDMIINPDVRTRLMQRLEDEEGSNSRSANQAPPPPPPPPPPRSPDPPSSFRYTDEDGDDDDGGSGGGGGGGAESHDRSNISDQSNADQLVNDDDVIPDQEEEEEELGEEMEHETPDSRSVTPRFTRDSEAQTDVVLRRENAGTQTDRRSGRDVGIQTRRPVSVTSMAVQTDPLPPPTPLPPPPPPETRGMQTQTNWEVSDEETAPTVTSNENGGQASGRRKKQVLTAAHMLKRKHKRKQQESAANQLDSENPDELSDLTFSNDQRQRVASGKVTRRTTSTKKKKLPLGVTIVPPTQPEVTDVDPSEGIRMTRSRKRSIPTKEDKVNRLGETAKKNKNSLWDPNDSDLDDDDNRTQ